MYTLTFLLTFYSFFILVDFETGRQKEIQLRRSRGWAAGDASARQRGDCEGERQDVVALGSLFSITSLSQNTNTRAARSSAISTPYSFRSNINPVFSASVSHNSLTNRCAIRGGRADQLRVSYFELCCVARFVLSVWFTQSLYFIKILHHRCASTNINLHSTYTRSILAHIQIPHFI